MLKLLLLSFNMLNPKSLVPRFLVVYILLIQILNTNTRSSSSSHWKLVVEDGKNVIAPNPAGTAGFLEDENELLRNQAPESKETNNNSLFNNKGKTSRFKEDFWISSAGDEQDELVLKILTTTVLSPKGLWTKNGADVYCSEPGKCEVIERDDSGETENSKEGGKGGTSSNPNATKSKSSQAHSDILDCGRPANFTYYDQLNGIANRHNHPHIPEPQVAILFRKKGSKKDTINLNTLETKLRKAKKEKPSSVQLYNQIGNFWRIKGHTLRAIECFRRALAVAPNNPEVLHNLARLLLTLQYLDDALFLARRSLELQAPDRSAWQQHFTLGEILKAYGHHQEAVLHFKHTLELRPDHLGAQDALKELETLLAGSGLHICTLLIIIFLVLGVLLVMLSSLDNEDPPDFTSRPPPRHFSRALAMRSLKLGISPRALRSKRLP